MLFERIIPRSSHKRQTTTCVSWWSLDNQSVASDTILWPGKRNRNGRDPMPSRQGHLKRLSVPHDAPLLRPLAGCSRLWGDGAQISAAVISLSHHKRSPPHRNSQRRERLNARQVANHSLVQEGTVAGMALISGSHTHYLRGTRTCSDLRCRRSLSSSK